MRHGWLDPKRKDSNIAVGVYYHPGGFEGARLVRPAVVELGTGQLVDIPLTLVDDKKDVVQMVDDLISFYDKNYVPQPLLPPKKAKRKRGPKGKKK